MADLAVLEAFLAAAHVDPAVFGLRPDYRVLLLAVDGVNAGSDDEASGARNSLGALLRRVPGGLPRVNGPTDIYNAISVLHQLPLGGEDLHRYVGAPRLVRASGEESFDTVADGIAVVEHPEPGEVVWCDDAGVTCRRWNWRQARRTQLREDTTTALFILDALSPMSGEALHAAADDLAAHLRGLGPDVRAVCRLIAAT